MSVYKYDVYRCDCDEFWVVSDKYFPHRGRDDLGFQEIVCENEFLYRNFTTNLRPRFTKTNVKPQCSSLVHLKGTMVENRAEDLIRVLRKLEGLDRRTR